MRLDNATGFGIASPADAHMPPIAELLFVRNWWSWNDQDPSWHSVVVHWFNLFEGCVWCVFAALVYFRYRKHRHSSLELVYAAAFLLFGATDFVEAFSLTSWLMWIKLVTLIALWRLRTIVRRQWYPTSRLH